MMDPVQEHSLIVSSNSVTGMLVFSSWHKDHWNYGRLVPFPLDFLIPILWLGLLMNFHILVIPSQSNLFLFFLVPCNDFHGYVLVSQSWHSVEPQVASLQDFLLLSGQNTPEFSTHEFSLSLLPWTYFHFCYKGEPFQSCLTTFSFLGWFPRLIRSGKIKFHRILLLLSFPLLL